MPASEQPMPMCKCGVDYATVELKSQGKVLACAHCAPMLEMVAALYGAEIRKRPILGIVRGNVE